MVYDPIHRCIVLFGGSVAPVEIYRGDTWVYDGMAWTEIATSTSPPVRGHQGMFYDSIRQSVCLQGGLTRSGFRTFWPDRVTWSLDLASPSWSVVVSPNDHPHRAFHVIVSGRDRGPVYSFGGLAVGDIGSDDLASWDGFAWTSVPRTGAWPSMRVDHTMAYDSLRDRFIMFGGLAIMPPTYPANGETWELQESRLEVSIDIKPGSFPNSVNLTSNGVVPVAILSAVSFDATHVDPATVSLSGSGVAVRGRGSRLLAGFADVNDDGRLDLVLHVVTENLQPGKFESGYAILTGSTYDRRRIRGRDEISVVR